MRKKIIYTIALLALYRLFVAIPVPFVDINTLMNSTTQNSDAFGGFLMLLGGTLESFSILAVGLAPFINASIIIQLLTAVFPHFEELMEEGEAGQRKIQQYTRWATFPLALLQGFGMVYFINYLFGGGIIDTTSLSTVLLGAFVLSVGAMIMLWLGDLLTEKGVTNGVSLLIFASIVAGMVTQIAGALQATPNVLSVLIFIVVFILILVLLSIFILKSIKEIPVIYARQGQVQQTSILPIPMNPVGMIPIIFAMALASFPYIFSQFATQFGVQAVWVQQWAQWIEINFNIYSQNPSWWVIILYFILIVAFTFFYATIQFNPARMADSIQSRGGFIPGIRPGDETAKYIQKILNYLCLWGGAGLAFIGIFNFLIAKLPFVQQLTFSLGSLPLVVTGS